MKVRQAITMIVEYDDDIAVGPDVIDMEVLTMRAHPALQWSVSQPAIGPRMVEWDDGVWAPYELVVLHNEGNRTVLAKRRIGDDGPMLRKEES